MSKLTEIKQSLSKITQGEWYSTDDAVRITPHDSEKCVWVCQMFEEDQSEPYGLIAFENGENNAKFIADAPDYIKYLLSLLEEKNKALEKCFIAGNSLASVVMGYELPEGHEEWSHQTANAYFYDTYYNDRKSAYEGYETWLAWKAIHDVSREITSSNNEGES
ncbi:hypothetical protein NYE59_01555 [Paenibacillus sp. FSL L8-0323]|uniref:hypothetical protein n=1 Tax=Paenibacillus sp. FSL L8-0323 TaxID=2975330 RepID=UPI0030FBB99D